MKIYVIGTGAVGGYFGSLLSRSGADITFVGREVSANTIKKNGLVINDISYPVKIIHNFQEIANPDLVLLAVKSYHLPEIVPKLTHLSNDPVIICLQNGINNDLIVKRLNPKLNVHPGLVYVSAKKVSPGVISQSGPQKTLIFGRRDSQSDEKFIQIESVLKESGIDARLSTNIKKDLWQKYIFVVSFAAVTARFRVDIGTALSNPEMRSFYLHSLQECLEVAKAEGIALDPEIYNTTIRGAENFPPNTKSSLLVDLENNRQTEIDTLHGTLVDLAHSHGLNVPTNQLVLDLFKK